MTSSLLDQAVTLVSAGAPRRDAARTPTGWLTFEAYLEWVTRADCAPEEHELPLEEDTKATHRATWAPPTSRRAAPISSTESGFRHRSDAGLDEVPSAAASDR